MARPAGSRATVREVAAETGVSIATVSRVLNDAANVSPATRQLVLQAVGRLSGLGPTRHGPRPGGRGGAVYVRCPYVLSDYFALIVSSIAETLELHGQQPVLNAGESSQDTDVLAGLSARQGVAGAILILPPEPSEALEGLRAEGFPFVVVDPRTPVPRDIASVSAAHFAGARHVTRHLVELGHRRIGVVAGPQSWLPSEDRLAGHTAAMADVGVLPSAELVCSGKATAEAGYAAAGRLLDLADPPTALVCFNDKAAVGALTAAYERGLRVPDDLSIAGFDDLDLSRATHPMLTTVRQPLQEMGRMSVVLLMRLLERHRVEALHVELATELVVRGSTGPAPTSR